MNHLCKLGQKATLNSYMIFTFQKLLDFYIAISISFADKSNLNKIYSKN